MNLKYHDPNRLKVLKKWVKIYPGKIDGKKSYIISDKILEHKFNTGDQIASSH